MSNDSRKRGLGRGLSALLGEEGAEFGTDGLQASRTLPIELLSPGRFQPRRRVTEEGLEELSRSIADKGILQPILVRRNADDPDGYEIIAGERRWRAAQMAQLHDVPVVVKELADREALEIALVENLQRQDLSVLEEAEGYRRLMDEFAHNQEDLARSVGKSRSHVANTMRLLALPDSVKTMLDDGRLTAGHARALLTVEDPAAAAERVVKRGLNVRQTEQLVKTETVPPAAEARPEKDPDTLALERDLGNLLGLKVEIKLRRNGGGSLVLHYHSFEQLDDILHRLDHGRHAGPAVTGETRATSDLVDAWDDDSREQTEPESHTSGPGASLTGPPAAPIASGSDTQAYDEAAEPRKSAPESTREDGTPPSRLALATDQQWDLDASDEDADR